MKVVLYTPKPNRRHFPMEIENKDDSKTWLGEKKWKERSLDNLFAGNLSVNYLKSPNCRNHTAVSLVSSHVIIINRTVAALTNYLKVTEEIIKAVDNSHIPGPILTSAGVYCHTCHGGRPRLSSGARLQRGHDASYSPGNHLRDRITSFIICHIQMAGEMAACNWTLRVILYWLLI